MSKPTFAGSASAYSDIIVDPALSTPQLSSVVNQLDLNLTPATATPTLAGEPGVDLDLLITPATTTPEIIFIFIYTTMSPDPAESTPTLSGPATVNSDVTASPATSRPTLSASPANYQDITPSPATSTPEFITRPRVPAQAMFIRLASLPFVRSQEVTVFAAVASSTIYTTLEPETTFSKPAPNKDFIRTEGEL